MAGLSLAEVDADRRPRCCAKCKTPYMCGNEECKCHPKPDGGYR